MSINDVGVGFAYAFIRTSDLKRIELFDLSPYFPLSISWRGGWGVR